MDNNKYNYVVDLTFYAGSDAPEDTDNELVVIQTTTPYDKNAIIEMFKTANELLSDENHDDFPTYTDGLNIDTLLAGFCIIATAVILPTDSFTGMVSGVYKIVQWQ